MFELTVPLDSANVWLDRVRQSRVIFLTALSDGSREMAGWSSTKEKNSKVLKARATEKCDPFRLPYLTRLFCQQCNAYILQVQSYCVLRESVEWLLSKSC